MRSFSSTGGARRGRGAIAIAVLLLVGGFCPAAQAQTGPGGPAGCWPFDGDGRDSSGNGRDVQLVGSPAFVPGYNKQAIALAAGQAAERPVDDDAFDFGGSDFTVSAWVNVDDAAQVQQMIVSKWQPSITGGWYLRYEGNGAFLLSDGHFPVVYAVGTVTSGTWHHIVVRRSGSTSTMHLDGALIGQHDDPVSFPNHTAPLRIGQRGGVSNFPTQFFGKIDDVGLWNRVATDGEIAAQCSPPAQVAQATTTTITVGGSTTTRATLATTTTVFGATTTTTLPGGVLARTGGGRDYLRLGMAVIVVALALLAVARERQPRSRRTR